MQYIRGTYSISSLRSQYELVLFAFIMSYIFFACEIFCIVNPLFFSQDTASIAAVILAMDKLDSHLNPRMKKPYHPAIQAAMKLACKKINRYYSMTDLSSAYRIAMGK